jgi:RimJ/RimL family protein N-acetyltransferase
MTKTIINWQPENLEDNLVKLIPIAESDFESIFKVASDPLIWEQHPTKDRYKREVFQLYFDGAISSKTAFLIVDRSSDKIIGSTRYYDYKPDNSSIAIGFTFLSREYWGGLYNKSSKRLLLDYAFRFVDKVYFHIGAANLRSQLATMKIGATKINEVVIDHHGQNQLHYEYLIQKQEWK